jgi:alpha-ribazole phosphatase/probable phosphoglycerate mutase
VVTVRVWCLRHAESRNVTAGIAGAVPSAPLTERGRGQATAAARTLADEPLTTVYASTALRAEQTARLLAGPGADVVATPELAEVATDHGARSAVRARLPGLGNAVTARPPVSSSSGTGGRGGARTGRA